MDEKLFLGMMIPAILQLGGLVVMLRKLSGAVEARRIEPQPLEVKAAADYMTRSDCERFHSERNRFENQRLDEISKRLAELSAALERRNQEGETRAVRIHGRVDDVVASVSELRGQVDNHITHHPGKS